MNIKYFGEIADITGQTAEVIVFQENSLETLLGYLKKNYQLSENDFYLAINHQLADTTQNIQIADTDEVAILSPFAGG